MIRQDEVLKISETVLIFRKQSIEFLNHYLSFPKRKQKLEINKESKLNLYLLHIPSGWTYSFQDIGRDRTWLKLAYAQDKESVYIDDFSKIKIGKKQKPKRLALPEIFVQIPNIGRLIIEIPCFWYHCYTKDGYLPIFQKLDGKFFYRLDERGSETKIMEIELDEIKKTNISMRL